MLGLSSNRLYIGGSNSESFRCNLELEDFVAGAVFAEVGDAKRFILRGRRSIW